jgi:hypothetical protein
MYTAEVTNTAALLEKAREACSGFGRTSYWYRGHAKAEWKLVPSVHRDYDNLSERSLLTRFLLGAPTRSTKCPALTDSPSWLTLMQHYGLPTRLLDWTASLIAATYFAVSYEPKPGDGAVWILSPGGLNGVSSHKTQATLVISGPECNALVSAAFNAGSPNREVLAIVGQDVDMRMTVQQGAFTIHGDDTPLEEQTDAHPFLAKLIIPESAKPTFDEELWVLGVRRAALFPDLANLARDLANDWRASPKKTTAAASLA